MNPTLAVTGATGQLGQLVIDQLLRKNIAPASIVAVVRDAAKASNLTARGISVRVASYTDSAALVRALTGVDRLLLISSSEIGQRAVQHRNVIATAKQAGVKLVIYTSLLHADTTSLNLAPEHRETEAALKASGIPFVILRNGWYTENYTVSIPGALGHGAFVGSAKNGRVSWAPRADYAAAAVAALTGKAEVGKTYELAGDTAGTLTELAAEISRQAGRTIPYHDLPEATYRDILLKAGLPPVLAAGLAAWDVDVSRGELLEEGRALSKLIGRPTTPLADSVKQALSPHRT